LRTFIKIGQQTIFALLLMGCTHIVVPVEAPAVDPTNTQTSNSYFWHDGSTGGEYGIGEGWTIELLPAEYETVIEDITPGSPIAGELPVINPEYEWVKDDYEDGSGDPMESFEFITIPAEFMTVTETVLVNPEKTEYYLTEAVSNSDGSIAGPRSVRSRQVPAVTREMERKVVKTPKRFVERKVFIDRRKGFRLVVKPGRQLNENSSSIKVLELRRIKAQPWRFIIKHPKGYIAHVFDDFDAFKNFVDNLK